jgi:hypothetical protein
MRVWGAGRHLALVAVAFVFGAVSMPGTAAAANVVNGDFETGTLAGWHVQRVTAAGNWFAYQGTSEPIAANRGPLPQQPPQGTFAAISDELNPETLILYQDVALPPGRSETLSLLAYFDSTKPIAIPPSGTLSVDGEVLEGNANQQYRIDVMRPEAPLESIDPADVLRPVFHAAPGTKKMMPTRLTADLGAFAGQTVRLRFAVAAHEELLTAGVDAVSISSNPPRAGSPAPGSDRFSIGRPRLNVRKGTASLPVKVPGAGSLSAKDAGSAKSARAVAAKVGKRPKLIKPVSVKVAKAGSATIDLKPTPPALAILRQEHKLRVKVAVTFVPRGGSPQKAIVPVLFKLVAHHRR